MQQPQYDEVLQFVREHSRPFVTTTEVAEEFTTVGRKTIMSRLKTLSKRGELEMAEVGASSKVFYVPEEPSR